jgi:hypothetical protein
MTAVLSEIIERYQGIAPRPIIAAVQKAAARTGADFAYLMEKASAESGFDPKAASPRSSATGLFQFIESTWLKMVKDHGAQFGLGRFASQIEIRDGKPCVDDCKVKDQILALRKNPEISALMAGAYSKENQGYLERHIDGKVGDTELYLAHFLGAGSAARFLNARAEDGNAPAARLFPHAARANRGVFFDAATHKARTLDQVYALIADKFNDNDESITGTASPSSAAVQALPPDADPADAQAPAPQAAALPAPGQAHLISASAHKLSPAGLMVMAQMQDTMKTVMSAPRLPSFTVHTNNNSHKDRFGYNA